MSLRQVSTVNLRAVEPWGQTVPLAGSRSRTTWQAAHGAVLGETVRGSAARGFLRAQQNGTRPGDTPAGAGNARITLRPLPEQFGERRLLVRPDGGTGQWRSRSKRGPRSRSPTMRDARNHTVRTARLASPESVETTPQCDRPCVGDHLRTRPDLWRADKTGDTRLAFRSARKPFFLRKSRNTFGDRHRACVNCPTNLRSGSHGTPPPPSSSRRTRPARRSPPESHPSSCHDQRKRGRGRARTPEGRHGRHDEALETNGSGTMDRNAPKWPKSIFSQRPGWNPPGGHETPKRSDTSIRKTRQG